MKLTDIKSGLISTSSAFIASLCCALPLAIVLLGLGSGAFMMMTMQYRWLFLPIGVVGVSLGYILYFREKRRCARLACRMAGSRVNLILLLFATLLLAFELFLTFAPRLSASLLARVMAENPMGAISGEMSAVASPPAMTAPQSQPAKLKEQTTSSVQEAIGQPFASLRVADVSSVTLKIDGMT